MKKAIAIIVIVIAIVLTLRIAFNDSDSQYSIDEPTAQSDETKSASSGEKLETVLPPTRQRDNEVEDEKDLVDGVMFRKWGDFIKAKDFRSNCRTERQVIRDVPKPEDYFTRCGFRTEFDHPYALFTDEQLEQIADNDWEAAYLLAHRLLIQPSPGKSRDENPQKGLSYAMNALVHTAEKQIFDLLIQARRFKGRPVWYTVDGVPSAREIRQKAEEYVWHKAGHDLGFIDDDDYQWRKLHGQMERFEEYFDMNELNSRAETLSDGVTEGLQRFAEREPE